MVNLSIKTKATALFVCYVLALTAVYVTFSFRLLRRESREAVDRLQQTANILATELETSLDAGRQRLETVGRLPGLTFGLQSIAESASGREIPAWTTLHYLFFKSPLFTDGAFLLDRSGKVVWNEPPDRDWRGRSLSDNPVIRASRSSKATTVSDGLGTDELAEGPHALVANPILSREGEIVGFIGGVVGLRTARFLDIVKVAPTADGRFVVVTDGNGRIVAGTTGQQLLDGWSPSGGPATSVLASKPLAGSPWRVWAGQPEVSALANVRQLQRLLLILGLALALATVAVGVPVIHDFSHNVTLLTRHAEVMASGDLSRPVLLPPRGDELGVLAATFERTRAQLKRSREALEARLVERDDLLRLKEEFLANISHELRTPLNVIFGYAEMLEDRVTDGESLDVLGGIHSQAGRLLQLINDLMTLSGLSAGKLEVKKLPVDVRALVERLVPLADRLSRAKDLEVLWDVPTDLPLIHTDEHRLEQVLSNLLVNAVKFTPGGKVAVQVQPTAEERRITFVVSDTGIGIPKPDLPHIFDEFRQVDGSMSRQHGGMGLGLAVVRKLVTLLGGEIEVRSLVGSGSTFIVSLPIGDESDRAGEASPPPRSGRTVSPSLT
jgi:signal transduction histidine kinase